MANETTKQQGKKTRARILHAIISYIEEHGYPPSYREIGQMVGLKSNATIHTQIKIMLAHGMIESDAEEGCSPRAIRVPGYTFVKKADIERLTPKEITPAPAPPNYPTDNVIHCPTCGKTYWSADWEDFNHCPHCGQAIKIKEEKNE